MTVQVNTAATSQLPGVFERFFAAKTGRDAEGTMAFFAPDMVCYIEATLGWVYDSHAGLKTAMEEGMPAWAPQARSYASKILAGQESALVYMVDTPEMFGGELRILGAVDFADGKIVRWVDYWDSTTYGADLYHQYRTPADQFPTDLGDARVENRAHPALVKAATALHEAFAASDPAAATPVLHPDVVLADMALRTQVIGRIEVTHYLERVLGQVPYGRASVLRHVVGGPDGGGFEWTARPEAGNLVGITALELDADGLITSITSVYDSRQIDSAGKRSLISASFEQTGM